MHDVPWHVPARLFDRISNNHYVGTLKSALTRWTRLPRDSQALAIVYVDAVWYGRSDLRAADLRELLLERGEALS